jgi:hypothetical protein
MSIGAYTLDVVLLVLVACSAALTGRSARRLFLPSWVGAPARVAESVCGIAAVVVVAELLGSVGEFSRWPVVATLACLGALAVVISRRYATPAPADLPPPRLGGRVTAAFALIAVVLAVSRSLQSAVDALHSGMLSFDTLWYHLPFAARFFQDGSLTHLHYVGNGPTTFYPANGEVMHALGMLLFHGDVLSPVVNVAWVALALLAGWCVGRPYGVAPATMLATCLVAFLPVMGGAQAGTAGTDIAVLALLVAAVALVVNGLGSPAALSLAAVAAGLAAGTKLDAWSIVVALGILTVVLVRGRRLGTSLRWVAGVTVASGYWYLRNLVSVGNPFPWFGAGILPSTASPSDCGRTSVAHYLPHPGFLSAHVLPQLAPALGARWWLVVGLAAIGTATALLSPRPLIRGLAVVALVGAVAYVFTPATAGGHEARCFSFNTRFATPPLTLGLILLPITLATRRFGPLLSVLALAFTLALTLHPSHELAPLVGVAALLVAVYVFGTGAHQTLPRVAKVALVVAVALLAVLGGRHEQQAYASGRYVAATFSDPVAPIAARLLHVHDARIAVIGLSENYPLYGSDLSNRVRYPARRDAARFLPYSTCRGWLLALADGHYNYVVTARESRGNSPAAAWTRHFPGARELLASTPGEMNRGAHWTWHLFQLDPARPVDPGATCRRMVRP